MAGTVAAAPAIRISGAEGRLHANRHCPRIGSQVRLRGGNAGENANPGKEISRRSRKCPARAVDASPSRLR